MPSTLVALLLGSALLLAPAARAQVTIGGGGGARTDCLLVLQASPNTPTSNPRHVRCADGDPACDEDGTVNGVCKFAVAACGNSTFDSRCTSPGVGSIVVDHALDNGDIKFDPEFQALQNVIDSGIDIEDDTPDDCTTTFIDFHVAVQGPFANNTCRRDKKLLKITTESDFAGGTVTDRDRYRMICDPSPSGCDPMAFYTSAFDRIQRQIFNQTCAVGGCHDSQDHKANLILEDSSAYMNLVNVVPDNDCAEALGWMRINVTTPDVSGDPATSFLFHKIDHDLPHNLCTPPDDLGDNMPLIGPKLDQSLIDVVEAWIAAGAPTTGWPPGTF